MKNFLIELFKDIIGQAWTLLGMAVAWLVLEGSAKALTGNLIGITLAIWIITFPLRYEKPEQEEKKPVAKKPAARKKPVAKKPTAKKNV